MSKMHDPISALLGLIALAALTGCGGPGPAQTISPMQTPTTQPTEPATLALTPIPPPTETPWPTETPVAVTPTLTPHVTSTPIPAFQMRGKWRRFTTADGLCTNMTQYEGVTEGTRSDVLPRVQRTSPWTWTGILAQNMGGSMTDITLRFYYQSGTSAGSTTKYNVYPETPVLYWAEIPTISGSAVASSSPAMPVGLMVNFDRLGYGSWTNRDGMMGYGAVR